MSLKDSRYNKVTVTIDWRRGHIQQPIPGMGGEPATDEDLQTIDPDVGYSKATYHQPNYSARFVLSLMLVPRQTSYPMLPQSGS
jgi:hypothetical protein